MPFQTTNQRARDYFRTAGKGKAASSLKARAASRLIWEL